MRELAQALELPVLQDTQQLGLQLQRQIGDLVQKQRALVRQLDAPQPLVERSGERAFFVPEHFAFEQTRGNRRAVEFHERPVAAVAELMQRARD